MDCQYTETRDAPPNRRGFCLDDKEEHLTEGAVILAFGLYLLDTDAELIELHPDGEHGKRFDFATQLSARGFERVQNMGRTSYGGVYKRRGQSIILTCSPGRGDVTGKVRNRLFVAECKGGVINTAHPGQTSRLRQGLCEAVGLLMTRPCKGERHFAVVPNTATTRKLAERMLPRLAAAQIEVALVQRDGEIELLAESVSGSGAATNRAALTFTEGYGI